MTNIRVICSDLDGTLLDDNKELSVDNVAAIKRWQQRGKLFGITSGRQLDGVERALNHQITPDFIVCLNGGRVQTVGGQVHWNRIDNAAALQALRVMLAHASKMVKVTVTENGETTPLDLSDQATTEQHLTQILQRPGKIFEKIAAKVVDDKFSRALLKELALLPVTASWSDRFFVEVAAEGINKLTGLQQALTELIPLEQVAAIGDYGNDLAIIQGVGYGIAVANASASLKRVADAVTTSNNDHAIAQVIQKLLKA